MRSTSVDADGTQVIQGWIVAPGGNSLTPNKDYVVSKVAPGDYIIRFTKPFRGIPTVTATPDQGGFIRLYSANSQYVEIATYNKDLAALDAGFSFTVRGLAA